MADNDNAAPAGWHDDPEFPDQLRYWDGSQWTEHRSPKAGADTPAAAATEPATYGAITSTQGTFAPATSAPRSGAPWWLAAVMSIITLGIGVGVGMAIGGGSDDDAKASGDKPAATAGETPTPTIDASGEPTADGNGGDEPASSGGGTAQNPAPMATPWTYDTSYFGEDATQWEGTFEGIVELPVWEYEEDQSARCYAIIGTMTPTHVGDGAFTTTGFDTPDMGVIVGGAAPDEYGSCDTEGLEAAGYGGVLYAEVSEGTAYKFYQEVFLPSTITGDIDMVVLGQPSDAESTFFVPEMTTVG